MLSIKGAKAGSKKQRKPNIQKDTAASISTVMVLYGLSEGEVEGLSNGANSIKLDDTPLADTEGVSNFSEVTYTFLSGTNDQEYIKGFPDVSNEIQVGTKLRYGHDWVQGITNTDLSAVNIRLRWGKVSKTNSSNGDVSGYRIDYSISVKTDSGTYQEVLRTKLQDKVSAGYERTHRINLPKAKSGWQVKVTRLTKDSTSDLIQDEMFVAAYTEVIDAKLTYPNTALLALGYNSEVFKNIAKLSVRMKGLIIQVPDNYDPVTRTYNGIWSGKFKQAYTNNPAWIYYDLCTQWRYGIGANLDASMVDKWSIYQLGQYCDQMVDDGKGGKEPRFTCNLYLQKQESAYAVLRNIGGIFRALSYWNGEQIILDCDMPKDPVYVISKSNIIGRFSYTGTRQRDRHTVIKVSWDNPDNGFQTEYEYVRDEKAIAKYGVKVLDMAGLGCTSQGQAKRLGQAALLTEQLETRQVSFKLGMDGAIPRVGNVVTISDDIFAGRANGGRISAVSAKQNIITVDRDVIAKAGDKLIINNKKGKAETGIIKAVKGRAIEVTTPFEQADTENIWAVETTDLKLMQFRIMSVKENDDNSFDVVGIQYEPRKFDAIDFNYTIEPPLTSLLNSSVVKPPASVKVAARYHIEQRQTIATLVIEWDQVEGAAYYEVQWRKDDGAWITIPKVFSNSTEVTGIYSGNYTARVSAISPLDVPSLPAYSTTSNIKGKAGNPPKLSSFKATGLLFGMRLDWAFASKSEDGDYVEIEVATAPNTNIKPLGRFAYPTTTHEITGLSGGLTQYYRARIVDKIGNKSAWSAWVSGTVDASPDKILDIVSGEIREEHLYKELGEKISLIDDLENFDDTELRNEIARIEEENAQVKLEQDKLIGDAINKANDTADKLAKESKDRADAISAESKARADAIAAEAQARNEALVTEAKTRADAINAEVKNRKNAISAEVTARNKALQDEALARKNAIDAEVQNRVDAIKKETADRIEQLQAMEQGFNTSIEEVKTDTGQAFEKAESAFTKANENVAYIDSKTKVLADADQALSESVTALATTVDGNTSAIISEAETRVSENQATAKRIDSLVTTVGNNTTAIATEAETRTTENEAIGKRIDTLTATVGDNTSAITTETNARVTENKAIAGRIDKLTTTVGNNTSAIVAETEARTTATDAITRKVDALVTTVGDNTSAIIAETEARTTENEATTKRIDSLVTVVDGNTSAITSEAETRTTENKAITKRIDTLTATVGSNTSAITTETQARTTADNALTKRIDSLVTTVGKNTSSITSESKTRADADKAMSERVDALTSVVDGNTSAIISEAETRASENEAIGKRINSIDTAVGKNSAAITEEANTRTTENKAITNRLNSVESKAGSNTTKISSLEKTVATNTETIATTKNELTASFNKAIDDLEIGGRNLLENSNVFALGSAAKGLTRRITAEGWLEVVASEGNGNYISATIPSINSILSKLNAGDYITVSADIKGDGIASNTAPSLYLASNMSYQRLKGELEDGKWVRVSYTRKYVENTSLSPHWGFKGLSGTYSIKNLKVEKGTKATDWSPAPEDVDSMISKNTAAITSEAKTRADEIEAEAKRINALTTTVEGNTSAIQSEQKTRSDADTALGKRIDTVVAKTDKNAGAITTETKARSDADTALGKRIDTVTATANTNKSGLASEITARANADTALGKRIDTVTATANGNKSTITTLQKTVSDNTKAIGTVRTDLTAEFKKGINDLSLGGTNLITNSNNMGRFASSTYGGSKNSIKTDITVEEWGATDASEITVSGGSASLKSTPSISVKGGEGKVFTYSFYAKNTGDKDVRFKFNGFTVLNQLNDDFELKPNEQSYFAITGRMRSNFDWFQHQIYTDEASAKVTLWRLKLEKGDKATDWSPSPKDTDSAIEANKASISSESKTRADADTALGGRIDAVTATANNNKSGLATEVKARADADSALSTRINTAQSKADSNASKITTIEKTVSDNTKAIAEAKTEIIASYKVKDTRNDNQPPSWYFKNYKRDVAKEFKNKSKIGLSGGTGTYCYLETTVKYGDTSGGNVVQVAYTDDGKEFVRQGKTDTWTAWVEKETTAGSKAKVDALKTELNKGISANTASIAAESKARADADSAMATKHNTLSSTVGGHTTTISQHTSSINGLNAQYTVKVDSGGSISGFGLASTPKNGTPTSVFAVRANKFYIAPPTTTSTSKGVIPFTVEGSNTYIKSAFIKDASIATAKIANGAITNAKIGKLAVDAAKIKDGAITTAKIGNAQVDTLQIKGNAVTVPRLIFFPEGEIDFAIRGDMGQAEVKTYDMTETTLQMSEGHISVRINISYINIKQGYASVRNAHLIIRQNGVEVGRRLLISEGKPMKNNVITFVLPEFLLTPKTSNDKISLHFQALIAGYSEVAMGEASIAITGVKR